MPSKATAQNSSQLAITAYGLKATTGNTDFALFGAIATMLSTATEDSSIEVPSATGDGFDAARTAPIPTLADIKTTDRMFVCLLSAVVDATAQLSERSLKDKKHLLLIVLPATTFERSKTIDKKQWQDILSDELAEFTDLHIHFIHANNNVTKQLQTACAALQEDKFDSVIFAGTDSLLDQVTCTDLITTRRICSTGNAGSVIPGEAAACVVIQKVSPNNKHIRALISGITYTAEPNSGKADKTKLTGLSTVIQNVTKMAGQHPDNIDCLVLSGLNSPFTALEWYQTTQTVWPNTLSEQQRVAFQQGEIEQPKLKPRTMPEQLDPNFSLGEIGAAILPLELVLACARFDFNYPQVKHCLICDVSEFPFRGAILLSNPHANSATDSWTPGTDSTYHSLKRQQSS
ncbi:MAG: hypothetical protein ACC657_14200 [Thiohalomonadales bacterium]